MTKNHALIAFGNMDLEFNEQGVIVWRRGMPKNNQKALDYSAKLQYIMLGNTLSLAVTKKGGFKMNKLTELIEWLKMNDFLIREYINN